MKRLSIKLKVTLWYTVAMIVISAIVLFTVNSLGQNMLERDIKGRLSQTVNEKAKIIVGPSGRIRMLPQFELYEHGVSMVLYNSEHAVISGAIPYGISEGEISIFPDRVRTSYYNGNKYYEYDKKILHPGGTSFYLKGLVSVTDESYMIKSTTKNNAILTLVMILIAALGGYFIIRHAFVPVTEITKTAEAISKSNDLSKRINIGEGTDEIHSLAATFDKMLDKIEDSFEREKQFTSDASHELRTPIAVITSECEYMEECAKTVEDYKESLSCVKRQADKMSKLVSQLLTISRMDKNTMSVNFEEFDISELLSFVCDEQEEIHKNNVTLVRNITPKITTVADQFLIARAFINLISNAYQYIGDGDKIEVTLTENTENIVFSVKDNGIGISKEHLPNIWERFYQAESSRTSNENNSMGLGLSMVKWIAQCHNGSVAVESDLGSGSVFILTIPKHNLGNELL